MDIYESGSRIGCMDFGGDIYISGCREGYFSCNDIYKGGSRVGYISNEDLYVDGSRVGYVTTSGDMFVDGCRVGELADGGDVYVQGCRWGNIQGSLDDLEKKMYMFAFLYCFTDALK